MLLDDYTLTKLIGKGAIGKVYLASKKGENTSYAAKVLDKFRYNKNEKALKYLINEINILKDVNHPNILRCFEIKETLEKVYIITEYYNGGTLEEFLEIYIKKNDKAPSEEIVQYIMKQIIEGIKYLHNKKIIYRSICLSNIMINYEDKNDRINNNIMKGKIKIIDFGFSKYLKKGELTKTTLGYPITMDPIILFKLNKIPEYKESEYDEKVDIWSLGIIFYELLIGNIPFESQNMEELFKKIKKGDYYIPTTLSKETMSFLNCMLRYNSKERLNIDMLYDHDFLRKNVKEFKILELKDNNLEPKIKFNIYWKNDYIDEKI